MAKENGYIGGLVTGLLLGAAAALLLAPKKGGDVRGEIALGADSLKDKIVDLGSGAIEVVGDKIEDAKTKLTSLRATDDDNVQELVAETEEKAGDALTATVDSVEEVAEEIGDNLDDETSKTESK